MASNDPGVNADQRFTSQIAAQKRTTAEFLQAFERNRLPSTILPHEDSVSPAQCDSYVTRAMRLSLLYCSECGRFLCERCMRTIGQVSTLRDIAELAQVSSQDECDQEIGRCLSWLQAHRESVLHFLRGSTLRETWPAGCVALERFLEYNSSSHAAASNDGSSLVSSKSASGMSSAAPPSSSAPPPQSGVQDATSVPARQYSHTHPLACTFNAQQLPAPASCSESDGGSAKCRHDGNDGASHACTTEGHDEIARPSSAPPEREHARVRSHPAPPAIDKCRIFVGNIAWTVTAAEIRRLFEPFGKILKCDLQPLGAYGPERHKGYGFILFEDPRAATTARLTMNGRIVQGRAIRTGTSEPLRNKRAKKRLASRAASAPADATVSTAGCANTASVSGPVRAPAGLATAPAPQQPPFLNGLSLPLLWAQQQALMAAAAGMPVPFLPPQPPMQAGADPRSAALFGLTSGPNAAPPAGTASRRPPITRSPANRWGRRNSERPLNSPYFAFSPGHRLAGTPSTPAADALAPPLPASPSVSTSAVGGLFTPPSPSFAPLGMPASAPTPSASPVPPGVRSPRYWGCVAARPSNSFAAVPSGAFLPNLFSPSWPSHLALQPPLRAVPLVPASPLVLPPHDVSLAVSQVPLTAEEAPTNSTVSALAPNAVRPASPSPVGLTPATPSPPSAAAAVLQRTPSPSPAACVVVPDPNLSAPPKPPAAPSSVLATLAATTADATGTPPPPSPLKPRLIALAGGGSPRRKKIGASQSARRSPRISSPASLASGESSPAIPPLSKAASARWKPGDGENANVFDHPPPEDSTTNGQQAYE